MEVVDDWSDIVLDLLLFFQRVVRVRRISDCVALSSGCRAYMFIVSFGLTLFLLGSLVCYPNS